MVTLAQATKIYQLAREFYKPGEKSTNKTYYEDGGMLSDSREVKLSKAAHITEQAALQRINRRDANIAAQLNVAKIGLGNGTPVDLGRRMHISNNRKGNCGVMACLAMYIASKPGFFTVLPNNMWHVTAKNGNTKYWHNKTNLGIRNYSMTFGHSWAQLGSDWTHDAFIVDPWAGVVCPKDNYAEALKIQLNKWHDQGKRISVGFDTGGGKGGDWLNANDPCVLSLLADDATLEYIRGDETSADVNIRVADLRGWQ